MANTLTLWLSKKIANFEDKCSENPYSITYGVGRSLIAFSTLLVFVFNDITLLFNAKALEVLSQSNLFVNKINLFGLFGYDNLFFAKVFTIVSLLLVISGYLPRLTGILHFWIVFSFYNSAILLDGGEQIASIFTFLLLPICILDNRLNHWSAAENQGIIKKVIGHVVFKIIALQTAFIYFNTAVEKIYLTPEWKSGTAMFYIVNNQMFGMSDFMQDLLRIITSSKIVFFQTWLVILSHLALSYALFIKRKDKIHFIYTGILLHSAIALFMGLYSFSIVMFGLLVLYLLPFNFFIIKPWNHKLKISLNANI